MISYGSNASRRYIHCFFWLALYLLPLSAIAQDYFYHSNDYRNFYGICWRGTAHENLVYAKQMKYDYVFYQVGMEKDSLSNDLYFYLESPEYHIYNRFIDTKKKYTDSAILFYETYCALIKPTFHFPDNIARGWYTNSHTFSAQLDFQQDTVNNWAVKKLLAYVNNIEKRNPKFHFGGFAWDVPQLTGDFWDTIARPGRQIDLSFWNGKESASIFANRTHQYRTYSEGHFAFYQQLFSETRKLYPLSKVIIEPNNIYHDWVKQIASQLSDKYIMPDIILQEKYGTEFLTDNSIHESGLKETFNLGCSSPNRFEDSANRRIAAEAAIKGSIFCWYGRFGGTGNMPNYTSISQVPARLKLIRILTTWENLNHTPLADRHWNGTVYKSKTAYADENIIYIKQPDTNKIFFVLLSEKAKLLFSKDFKIKEIFNTDNFFKETTIASEDFKSNKREIEPVGEHYLNKGYIAYFK